MHQNGSLLSRRDGAVLTCGSHLSKWVGIAAFHAAGRR